MHIAIIPAGGAGMFCGSCMHDNTMTRALRDAGADVTLIPTYTPVTVDEENASEPVVFLGAINVYMESRFPMWKSLPRWLRRACDAARLLRAVARPGPTTNARHLGRLTLDMLDGESGPQRHEIDDLVRFVCDQLRPDVVIFSNALLVGVLRSLRQRFDGRVYCLLQGDDVFLEDLTDDDRERAIAKMSSRATEFDGFLTHSRFYRDHMAEYLNLPQNRFQLIPLGIDLDGCDGEPVDRGNPQFTVGYFARICPEKGIHKLVEAIRVLQERHPDTLVRIGGYVGPRDQRFAAEVRNSLEQHRLNHDWRGTLATRDEKIQFYKSLDVLSVPTVYREPKGLPVLEAMANGVPVVQPAHGAFPELIETTGGGLLFEPGNTQAHADSLSNLVTDTPGRLRLATAGHSGVRAEFDSGTMARRLLEVVAPP